MITNDEMLEIMQILKEARDDPPQGFTGVPELDKALEAARIAPKLLAELRDVRFDLVTERWKVRAWQIATGLIILCQIVQTCVHFWR